MTMAISISSEKPLRQTEPLSNIDVNISTRSSHAESRHVAGKNVENLGGTVLDTHPSAEVW
jgi:hypothetical protein